MHDMDIEKGKQIRFNSKGVDFDCQRVYPFQFFFVKTQSVFVKYVWGQHQKKNGTHT